MTVRYVTSIAMVLPAANASAKSSTIMRYSWGEEERKGVKRCANRDYRAGPCARLACGKSRRSDGQLDDRYTTATRPSDDASENSMRVYENVTLCDPQSEFDKYILETLATNYIVRYTDGFKLIN
ncbi:hypothetical protein V1477_009572 [Vespula maculifrons]|uniref:Uncharacterized protein n=1 Tax=Vespula maculifrons TaxID=7453 RepID=A0ABD2CA64_VESMC